jgi:hypothetical protein
MLFARELEHEIGRKPFLIAFHLFVEPLHRHAIELRNVQVEDDPTMTENLRYAILRQKPASHGVLASGAALLFFDLFI